MTVREYISTDASAPVLSGTAGAFKAVMKAILVDGYGAKTAAGWAEEFTGTNLSVFRAASGKRFRWRLDDTGTTECRHVGYVSMSDVNTGTEAFPTAVQLSGGLYQRKSGTADATARPWYCIADSTWFFFISFSAQTVFGNTSNADSSVFFGDFDSELSGDAYNCAIIGRTTTGTNLDVFGFVQPSGAAFNGHFFPRDFVNAGTSKSFTKSHAFVKAAGIMGSTTTALGPYPNPISGKINLARLAILEVVTSGHEVRGFLPAPLQALLLSGLTAFDTFSGAGALAGKNYRIFPIYQGSSSGAMAIEIP